MTGTRVLTAIFTLVEVYVEHSDSGTLLTTFQQCNIQWNFQKYSKSYMLPLTKCIGNSKIMHCGRLINLPSNRELFQAVNLLFME